MGKLDDLAALTDPSDTVNAGQLGHVAHTRLLARISKAAKGILGTSEGRAEFAASTEVRDAIGEQVAEQAPGIIQPMIADELGPAAEAAVTSAAAGLDLVASSDDRLPVRADVEPLEGWQDTLGRTALAIMPNGTVDAPILTTRKATVGDATLADDLGEIIAGSLDGAGRQAENAIDLRGRTPNWVLQAQFGRAARLGLIPQTALLPFLMVVPLGQSNVTQRSSVVGALEPPIQNVMTWNGTAWVLASGVPWIGSGFARKYATLAAQRGFRVGIVPCGLGSSSFNPAAAGSSGTWDRTVTTGSPRYLYPEAVTKVAAARAAAPTGSQMLAALWDQGEADTILMNDTTYAAKLDDLIAQFRIDTATPKLPFIISSLTPEYAQSANGAPVNNRPLIAAALEDTPRRVVNTAYHQGPRDMSEADGAGIHYTPEGNSLRGAEQAGVSLWQALENEPTSIPQPPHSFTITRSGAAVEVTWAHPFSRVTAYTIETSTDEGATWTAATLGARQSHKFALTAPAGTPVWVRGSATNEAGTSILTLPSKG